jgi:hypothetical protein
MTTKRFNPDVDVARYKGTYSPYDIIKEGTIALVVVALLVGVLAIVFGSPDEKSITIKDWSNAMPVDFANTAFAELSGTSATATYGPPYNNASTGQQLGPLKLAQLIGVHIPVNPAQDFVLAPLEAQPATSGLTMALHEWRTATTAQRTAWETAYGNAIAKVTFTNDTVVTPTTSAGPVPVLMTDLTRMARSGALDQALISQHGYYTMNYTKPLLFLADGSYLADVAQKQHLSGDQWGMMNETGSYPGQAWLWLYTLWYQISPMSTSGNGDILVWGIMMSLTALLALVPFIPGLRSIPRKTRIYRLIWREYYRN